MSEKNENARLETFCDGVFAIAITLLILEIKIPPIEMNKTPGELWQSIFKDWPSWFGFLLSFCIIFIGWVNHHNSFKLVDKGSPQFVYSNGFLLLTIIIIPFSTGIMAEYFHTENSQPAISLYCFTLLIHNVAWNMFGLAILHPHSLAKDEKARKVLATGIKNTQYVFFIYLAIFILSFWFPLTAMVIMSASWVTWIIVGLRLKHVDTQVM